MGEDVPRRRVRRTKQVRQREIAEATLRLVSKYGLRDTTVVRISKAVGLTPGALYRHYPNREAVLIAALDLMLERSSGWVLSASGPDVYQRLRHLGETHAAWAEAEWESFVHPVFEFIALGRQGHLGEYMRERQLQIVELLVGLVEQGQREGSLRADVDPQDIAWSVLMFAWSEDVARLMGVDVLVTSGASLRLFRRTLATFAAAPSGS
jgi:AcrR family transcriptional regulator